MGMRGCRGVGNRRRRAVKERSSVSAVTCSLSELSRESKKNDVHAGTVRRANKVAPGSRYGLWQAEWRESTAGRR
jgi:hypothetical protein